jgi:hypothetical protein
MSSFFQAAANVVSSPTFFLLHVPVLGRMNQRQLTKVTRVARECFLWGAAIGFVASHYHLFQEDLTHLNGFEGALYKIQLTFIESMNGGIMAAKAAVITSVWEQLAERLM